MSDDRSGARLEYIEFIDRGGFADVWRARDVLLDREVAAKVFRQTSVEISTALDHARALARAPHPNVVPIFDILKAPDPEDEAQLVDVVTMELVDGETLERRLQGAAFGLMEVRVIVEDLLAGLAAIHSGGIAHGDLSERNVMIDRHGRVRILDIFYRGTIANLPEGTRANRLTRDVTAALGLIACIVDHSHLDLHQLARFREAVRGKGDLGLLRTAFAEAIERAAMTSTPAPLLTAATPDVRVAAQSVRTVGGPGKERSLVNLVIQNHSPVVVYVQSVFIELHDGNLLYPVSDALRGTSLHNIAIQPGDNYAAALDPLRIGEQIAFDFNRISSVRVVDKIGREYRSNGPATVSAIAEAAARAQGDAAKEVDQQDVLKVLQFVADRYLTRDQWVPGRTIRAGLSPSISDVDGALVRGADGWLERGGQMHPHESYRPTLEGLLASTAAQRVTAFIDAMLDFLRSAVAQERTDFTSDDLLAEIYIDGLTPPFMHAVLSSARLIGGGGASGVPTVSFRGVLPGDVEKIIQCGDTAALARLRDAGGSL